MQDTLKALADMRVWQEVERETVEGRDAQRITAEAAQASLKSHQHRRKTIEARRPCYSTGIAMSSRRKPHGAICATWAGAKASAP